MAQWLEAAAGKGEMLLSKQTLAELIGRIPTRPVRLDWAQGLHTVDFEAMKRSRAG